MSVIGSMFGNTPGMQTVVETFERAYCWGPYPRYFTPAYIGSTAADPTNTPTWELRVGLLMGKITATGQWVNYVATATDGSNVAAGVLVQGLRMQDVLSGVNTTKYYAIMVSGGVQSANLIGLDNQARAQMSPHFIFDDNIPGNSWYEWLQFQTKTAATYTIVPTDNFTMFENTGATGDTVMTLPAILPGYKFGLRNMVAHNFRFTSAETGNMVTTASIAGNTASVAVAGGGLMVYSNAAGTLWHVQNISSYNQVVSFT